jgi:hypothetical protein
VVGPEDPELPEDIVEAAGRRLEREPYADLPDAELDAGMEQEIRDFWGYTGSEKSTRAERRARAQRIVEANRAQIAWAEALWQAQAERMPDHGRPDLKAKLQAQLKGKPEPPTKKKRSGWD